MVGSYAGSDVLRVLSRAATTARRGADDAEAAASRARDHVDALSRERMQTLRDLARTQLPELSAATAGASMPEIAAEIQQLEQQRDARAQQLAQKLAEHEQAMAAAKQLASQRTADLDRVVARRDELLQQAAAQLAQKPEYVHLSEETTQAEVRLARDIERRDELQKEAKEKLPPYERSRLFQYLWRRKFGTPEYGSRGFVARCDRRLANYIRYSESVASYKFLQATPEIVRLEVERRQAEVTGLRERVDGMERATQAEVGVPAVQAEVDRLLGERDVAVQRIDQVRQLIAQVHAAVRDEVSGQGVFHARAIERLTAFLSETETTLLARRAQETPDPKDDQLVAALKACTAELQRVGRDSPPLAEEAVRRDTIADALESVLVRFRQAEYDGGRSEFHGLDLDRLVDAVGQGSMSAESLWQQLRASQRFRQPPVVYHQQRTNDVLTGVGLGRVTRGGVGLAVQVGGAILEAALRSGVRIGGSSHRSSGSIFGRGGGFGGAGGGGSRGGSSSRGGDGGGFTSGRSF
jgi:hypothetical protein